MTAWWRAALVFIFLGFAFAAGAQERQAIPALSTRVTDLTGTLSANQRSTLEAKLAGIERQKGAQVAVLLVPTVQPETVSEYAVRVVEAWKLGRKGIDDGVLLLIAKNDRKLRIEVGYGLEGALTDAAAKRIISDLISPRFAQGDFYGGIEAGVDAIAGVISGESLPAPREWRSDHRGFNLADDFEGLLAGGFILVFVVGRLVRSILGRFLGASLLGGVAGVIVTFVFASTVVGIVVGVLAFIVSLLADGFVNRVSGVRGSGWPGSSPSGWGGGSSWGGGGFSDGGGGGFSGGGGGSGGGGASGGW